MAQGIINSTAELAYLGDAVYELLVREMILKKGILFQDLNSYSKNYVTAVAQARMYHNIYPILIEEEQDVMRRGRNLNTSSRAKSARVSEYRHATGLEALFGYLHLKGNFTRIGEIFKLCIDSADSTQEPI